MSRLVPFRPHAPSRTPSATGAIARARTGPIAHDRTGPIAHDRTGPRARPEPLHTRRTLLAEWQSNGTAMPGSGIEALIDWVESRT